MESSGDFPASFQDAMNCGCSFQPLRSWLISGCLAGTEKLPADTSKVEVEHIFPQTPNEEWIQYFEANGNEDIYVGRLGNLTLLGQKLNKQLSNKPYKEKRKTYFKKSDFTITKQLAKVSKWTARVVEKRQSQLFKHACEIWDVK